VDITMKSVRTVGPLLLLAASCGGGGSGPFALDVGGDGAGGGAFQATDGEAAEGLSVSLSAGFVCTAPGKCVTLTAQASGGVAPYSYQWAPNSQAIGSSNQVCPTATTTYTVTATDSEDHAGELVTSGKTGSAQATVQVSNECVDAAAPAGPDSGACVPSTAATGAAAMLPQTLVIDVKGSVRYFVDGASLPAGRYRIEYVDGCMEWGPEAGGYFWTINVGNSVGYPAFCELVGGSTTDVIDDLPGTISSDMVPGAIGMPTEGAKYTTVAACVAANRAMDAPLDFDFAGGKLGLFMDDALPGDDIGGETMGGVSPTWRLLYLGNCP
jgi:hypothetical protein